MVRLRISKQTFAPATRRVLETITKGDADQFERAAASIGFNTEADGFNPDSICIAGSNIDIATALATVFPIDDPAQFGAELDRLFLVACEETALLIDGAELALEELKGLGLSLGIATNDGEENAKKQMEKFRLTKLFDMIMGADSGHGGKPGPGMVNAFIENGGYAASQVMMVGDSLHDIEAGNRAGAVTVGVETGPATRQELESHADHVLPSIRELPDLIRKTGI